MSIFNEFFIPIKIYPTRLLRCNNNYNTTSAGRIHTLNSDVYSL